MEKVNSVKASKFLDWYFSDSDNEIREFGNAMLEQLKTFGTAKISIEQLFEDSWYIPQSICEDYDGVYEVEYEPSDVEFINDLKQ
tara:strand:+ start:2857 stop:3111 length:255 start_codon:yes stop_codon:yes gene_type:complete